SAPRPPHPVAPESGRRYDRNSPERDQSQEVAVSSNQIARLRGDGTSQDPVVVGILSNDRFDSDISNDRHETCNGVHDLKWRSLQLSEPGGELRSRKCLLEFVEYGRSGKRS